MKQETPCTKCRYFNQHYTKTVNQILAVHCGHCRKKELTMRDRKNFPFYNGCELWEPIEIREQERKEAVEIILRRMEKQLKEIVILLTKE